MSLKIPDSVEECLYFTNRAIGEGYAKAWVYRKECPKCKKGKLHKPLKKNGRIDKKAAYYECNGCGHQELNEETERALILEIKYCCPHCGFEGEATAEYKRKLFEGVSSYVFECGKCAEKIGITKKMKDTKQ